VQGIGALGAARPALAALDAALYAGQAWDGRAFWRTVRARLRRPPGRAQAKKDPGHWGGGVGFPRVR
jgi:hypothetical protein